MAWKGRDKFNRKMSRLNGPELERMLGSVVFEAADQIKAEAQNSITRGSVSGQNHVPSAPGEPPNNDTGHLKNNIESVRTGMLKAEVRSKAEYAGHLEFGTSKMAARPYMRPARDKKLPEVNRRLAEQLNKLAKVS